MPTAFKKSIYIVKLRVRLLQVISCTPLVLNTSLASVTAAHTNLFCSLITLQKLSKHRLSVWTSGQFFLQGVYAICQYSLYPFLSSSRDCIFPNCYFIFSSCAVSRLISYKLTSNRIHFFGYSMHLLFPKLSWTQFIKRYNKCHWHVLKCPKIWHVITHLSLVGHTSFSFY